MKTEKEHKINIITPQAILEAVKLGRTQAISEFKEKLKGELKEVTMGWLSGGCDEELCRKKFDEVLEKTAQEIK